MTIVYIITTNDGLCACHLALVIIASQGFYSYLSILSPMGVIQSCSPALCLLSLPHGSIELTRFLTSITCTLIFPQQWAGCWGGVNQAYSQPLMVISPTASWIRWCMQVYACELMWTCLVWAERSTPDSFLGAKPPIQFRHRWAEMNHSDHLWQDVGATG